MGRKKNKKNQNDTTDVVKSQQNQIGEELSTMSEANQIHQITIKETIENSMATRTEKIKKVPETTTFPEKLSPCLKEMLDTKILEQLPMHEPTHNCKELTIIANLWLSSIKENFKNNYATAKGYYEKTNNYLQQLSDKGSVKHSAQLEPSTMFNELICYEAVRWHCNSLSRQKQTNATNNFKRRLKFTQKELESYLEIILQTWKDIIQPKLTHTIMNLAKKISSNKEEIADRLQVVTENDLISILIVCLSIKLDKIQEWINCLRNPCDNDDKKILPIRYSIRGDQVTLMNQPLDREEGGHNEERFFFGLCPISLSTSSIQNESTSTSLRELKACSGCLSVCYAGREEQKQDWKRHKAICKILQQFVKKNPGHHPLSNNPEIQSIIQAKMVSTLKRPLTQYESDILVYPRLCMVCLNGLQANMITCPKCHCAAYCSNQHLEEDIAFHLKSCKRLQTALQDYRIQQKLRNLQISAKIENVLARAIQNFTIQFDSRMKEEENIEEVFISDLSLFFAIGFSEQEQIDIDHLCTEVLSIDEIEQLQGDCNQNGRNQLSRKFLQAFVLRQLTYKYTCPLTVLHGARNAGRSESSMSVNVITGHKTAHNDFDIGHIQLLFDTPWLGKVRQPSFEMLKTFFTYTWHESNEALKYYHNLQYQRNPLSLSLSEAGVPLDYKKSKNIGSKAVEDIRLRKHLTIHLVGARSAEVRDVTIWEILPLRLPNLINLTVVFIGPELKSPYPVSDFKCVTNELRELRPDIDDIRYVLVQDTYDGYVENNSNKTPKANSSFIRPDIVAVLNCGFIFYSSWDKSIPYLLKYPEVPLIFTEYYEEDSKYNLEKVDSLVDDELEVVMDPKTLNPFCSSLPARIPTGFAFRKFNRSNVVMSNDYICVVRSISE